MMGGVALKYQDVVRMLEKDVWRLERTVGSHLVFRHL